MEAGDGEPGWQCHSCTLMNAAGDNVCHACDEPSHRHWRCPTCTFVNAAEENACQACDELQVVKVQHKSATDAMTSKQAEREADVHFVGRLANYKYFNMDASIDNAHNIIHKITGETMEKDMPGLFGN